MARLPYPLEVLNDAPQASTHCRWKTPEGCSPGRLASAGARGPVPGAREATDFGISFHLSPWCPFVLGAVLCTGPPSPLPRRSAGAGRREAGHVHRSIPQPPRPAGLAGLSRFGPAASWGGPVQEERRWRRPRRLVTGPMIRHWRLLMTLISAPTPPAAAVRKIAAARLRPRIQLTARSFHAAQVPSEGAPTVAVWHGRGDVREVVPIAAAAPRTGRRCPLREILEKLTFARCIAIWHPAR